MPNGTRRVIPLPVVSLARCNATRNEERAVVHVVGIVVTRTHRGKRAACCAEVLGKWQRRVQIGRGTRLCMWRCAHVHSHIVHVYVYTCARDARFVCGGIVGARGLVQEWSWPTGERSLGEARNGAGEEGGRVNHGGVLSKGWSGCGVSLLSRWTLPSSKPSEAVATHPLTCIRLPPFFFLPFFRSISPSRSLYLSSPHGFPCIGLSFYLHSVRLYSPYTSLFSFSVFSPPAPVCFSCPSLSLFLLLHSPPSTRNRASAYPLSRRGIMEILNQFENQ